MSFFQTCSLLKLLFPFATGKMQQLINTYIGHFVTTLLELEYAWNVKILLIISKCTYLATDITIKWV